MSGIHPGHIFNVEEAHGKEEVECETTAAEARIEAPTSKIAHEIEVNAEHVHEAAVDAADLAKHKGPAFTGAPPSALDQLQQQSSVTTNAAVAEGKHDVEAAKAAGAEFVEHVKETVENAIHTAQHYLPDSVGGDAGTAKEALEKAKGAVQGSFGSSGTAPPESSATETRP
ncbi:hypothetical protein H0H92_013370 [Tricholoma furcatifolium]|nr:hypothetical protein H0H92_013370 [Tricholoma furcatifolium]